MNATPLSHQIAAESARYQSRGDKFGQLLARHILELAVEVGSVERDGEVLPVETAVDRLCCQLAGWPESPHGAVDHLRYAMSQ